MQPVLAGMFRETFTVISGEGVLPESENLDRESRPGFLFLGGNMYWLWMYLASSYELTATICSSWTCYLVVLCIVGYQRYLSPHKGFSCAHRVLHGRHSCSEFTKRTVQRRGVVKAVPLVRRRFAACEKASDDLKQKRSQYSSPSPTCDCGPRGDECACALAELACDTPGVCVDTGCADAACSAPHVHACL
jgi:putative component of membrane protein insertase Oxa1/YidC/SpoIIIJ protein YidD